MPAIKARLQNVWLALRTMPAAGAWLRCGAIYAAYVIVAAALGWATGFLKFELMSGSAKLFILVPLIVLIRPALLEEVVFRGMLFPHPREVASRGRVLLAGGFSLSIFVVMHPVNGMFVRHEAFIAFTHPVFLTLAALLGLACMIAYRISASLWPSILMHWMTVVVWTMFLGGKRMLSGS